MLSVLTQPNLVFVQLASETIIQLCPDENHIHALLKRIC